MSKVRVSAKALIIKEGKFLLLKEMIDNQVTYDVPGGKIEHGETPVETIHREIHEELGVKVLVELIKNVNIK